MPLSSVMTALSLNLLSFYNNHKMLQAESVFTILPQICQSTITKMHH